MKWFRLWRIELLMCEVVSNVKSLYEKPRLRGIAVRVPLRVQPSTTCNWILRTHTATHAHDRNRKPPNCSSQWEKFNDVKMKKIRRWRIELLMFEVKGKGEGSRKPLKFMNLSGPKSSASNISMRHRQIFFIFTSLDSSHWELRSGGFRFLSCAWVAVCVRRIQLHVLDEVPRVIGLGRCMEKMVGEITKKVGDITEKVGVYTASLQKSWQTLFKLRCSRCEV